MKPGLRISRFQVDGFGHFRGYSGTPGPGLTLLYGPNEAGKSTLLAFLRGVLFGFEKRGHPERYEPDGALFGGEVWLDTASGPLVVHRHGGKRASEGTLTVRAPEGQPLPETLLDQALADVPRELFFEVFAFRLDELSSFQRLAQQRGVSEALFAAGMQGARRLPEAVEQLRKGAEGLYAPRGQKPELNRVMKELEDVQQALREAGDRPALYFSTRDRLSECIEEGHALEVARKEVERELDHASRLESALGDLVVLARDRAELSTLPVLDTFPPGAETRLEDVLQRRKTYRAQQAQLQERLAPIEEARRRLAEPWPVRERAESLRAALGTFSGHSEQLRALPARKASLTSRRRQLEQTLGELGLAVDACGLLALDLGARARGELESLAGRLDAADATLTEVEAEQARTREERARLETALARTRTEVATLPEARPAQVRQRQAAVGRMRVVRGDLDRLAEQRLEQRRQLDSGRAPTETVPMHSPLPLSWVVAAAGVALGCAALAMGLSGWSMGVLCAVGGMLLVGLLLLVRHRVETDRRASLEVQAARHRWRQQEEERFRAAQAAMSAREELLQRELLHASGAAGLSPGASLADLAEHESLLAELLTQAERRDLLLREEDTLRTAWDVAVREEQRVEEARLRADQREGVLREEWVAFLVARRFPEALSAASALTLWRDAAALRQRLLDLRTDEEEFAVAEAACSATTSRLLAEARVAGLPPGSVETVAARVSLALEEVRTRAADQRHLDGQREELLAEKARLEQLALDEEQTWEALLAEGGCQDEASFRRRAVQARRYAELGGRVREHGQRVQALTGLEENAAREQVHAAGGEAGLKERLATLRERYRAEGERHKAVLTEQGSLKTQLSQWETDDRVFRLRIQEETLRARAAELATRYAADRLTLALLGRARRRFEEEQQPRVIQLASELFSELTAGRYRRVFIPAGDARELRVSDGARDWSAEQLSRGTREQLFLAFRLAVIRDFGETRGALPLIADDVLVNFDSERARGAVHLFARLAEHHQVIAFTCHPWLREHFEAEGAHVLELPGATKPPREGPKPLRVVSGG
ncbi:AAA family ATPase [Corallococcus sp. Z5C101001]|uniref:AAA family ATPase n=1 Tax=Corallococcus sp. Z5C101001 TaxID=2596829 RepID=UPI00117E037C|nr:AAA family ATPase [Corallococcus sp. Z5C101001]TSC24122.1 AAA family ATPase [Corallococcus sp. Z5C101001]